MSDLDDCYTSQTDGRPVPRDPRRGFLNGMASGVYQAL